VLYDPGVTGDLEAVRTLAATRGLILHAADDRRIRMESQRRWSELLTAADVVTVPNGGHQFLLRTGFASVVTWLEA
jgi:pimeloyl-ACP methyl ester carboxylesterase